MAYLSLSRGFRPPEITELYRLQRGQEAAEKLRAEGLDVRPLRIDVTDDASVAAAAAQLERDPGRLDILVNNAGIVVRKTALEISAEDWDRVLGVNLRGLSQSTEPTYLKDMDEARKRDMRISIHAGQSPPNTVHAEDYEKRGWLGPKLLICHYIPASDADAQAQPPAAQYVDLGRLLGNQAFMRFVGETKS